MGGWLILHRGTSQSIGTSFLELSPPQQGGRPDETVNQSLSDYYRVPERLIGCFLAPQLSGANGFFSLGSNAICYGQCGSGVSARVEGSALCDSSKDIRITGSEIRLSFDPDQVIENLRR